MERRKSVALALFGIAVLTGTVASIMMPEFEQGRLSSTLTIVAFCAFCFSNGNRTDGDMVLFVPEFC